MMLAAFDYFRASFAEEAVSLLGQHGDEAKLLAGGPVAHPDDETASGHPGGTHRVARLGELSYVRDGGDHIAIGSMTRTHDVHQNAILREHVPVLSFVAGRWAMRRSAIGVPSAVRPMPIPPLICPLLCSL